MKHKFYLALILVICFCNTHALAQVGGVVENIKGSLKSDNKDTIAWMHGGMISIGLNEGFLHNWSAGGEVASFTVNGIMKAYLTYYHKDIVWSNNLDLAYGLNYAYSNLFIPRKTDDRIDFTSKLGKRLHHSNDIYISGLFNFKSQFTKAYDYSAQSWQSTSTSNFLSPAYFTVAGGLEYRKGSNLSVFFSPFAARETISDAYYTLQHPQGAFGIDYGKTNKFQFGAYFSGRYTLNINKSTTFITRLDLYTDYLAKDTKDSNGDIIKKDNPGNIQIMSDNLLSWKATKTINIALGLTLIYDNNIPFSSTYVNSNGATVNKDQPGNYLGWLGVKQLFTIGLIYKF
jgi:hypothetical protein